LQRKRSSNHWLADRECEEDPRGEWQGGEVDPLEQEANRVASEVLATPSNRSGGHSRPPIQPFGLAPGGIRTAPEGVGRVLGGAGARLPAGLREDMEQRFGRDFTRVRLHSGAAAEQSARDVYAKAYTVGSDIVFGAGRFAPETLEGRRLIAHELTHVVQQSGLAGESSSGLLLQRDAIDDARGKLSYGLTDWAITDADAMEALASLATIPPATLGAQLKRLGTKYLTRLLDNLPDAAKSGEIYKRVIEAAGPAGVMPYAKEQLSYGLFDWAITDAEVTRVFNTFTNLPGPAQEQFLLDLDNAGRLGRLISNSNAGHHGLYIRPWIATLTRGALTPNQRTILRTIVAKSGNGALATITLAAETRFDVAVGRTTIAGRTPVDWDAEHLRKTYLALDHLPEAHVAKNKELLRFGQFTKASVTKGGSTTLVEGVYNAGKKELAINIEAGGDIEDSIIHETGHAVDQEMGWSTGPEPALPKRGGWKSYAKDYNTCATEMVDDSAAGIKTKLTAPQQTAVVAEMATSMTNQSATGMEARIKALPWFAPLRAPDKTAVMGDPALRAIGVGLNSPWFNATDGGIHLTDHIYQESYPLDWVRYRHEARSRMLTQYQFRDPGEWFAEAYAFYYLPDPRGKGAKLNDKDPDTKAYFDASVDTRAPTR
jgi:hypothetical protein